MGLYRNHATLAQPSLCICGNFLGPRPERSIKIAGTTYTAIRPHEVLNPHLGRRLCYIRKRDPRSLCHPSQCRRRHYSAQVLSQPSSMSGPPYRYHKIRPSVSAPTRSSRVAVRAYIFELDIFRAHAMAACTSLRVLCNRAASIGNGGYRTPT